MRYSFISFLFLAFLILCSFANAYSTKDYDKNLQKEVGYWDKILKKAVPKELKNIRIVTEGDIVIYKKYGDYPKASKFIYEESLRAYKSKEMFSFMKSDFNKNGKEDIALACIDTIKKVSYLVVLEKNKSKFKLIKYFQFKEEIFFIAGVEEQTINLLFQVGTDWMEFIDWDKNKKTYILRPENPYGP